MGYQPFYLSKLDLLIAVHTTVSLSESELLLTLVPALQRTMRRQRVEAKTVHTLQLTRRSENNNSGQYFICTRYIFVVPEFQK